MSAVNSMSRSAWSSKCVAMSFRVFGRLFLIAPILWVVVTGHMATAGEVFDDSEVLHIDYPDWFADSLLDLEDDLATAREAGKLGLMVLFTTEGCSYCDVFIRKSLGDPALAARVREHFVSVGLEIFDDSEMVAPDGTASPVKAFAGREGVMFSPTLLFFGPDGTRWLRVVGYQSPERFGRVLDYLTGEHRTSESLREYLLRTNPPAAADVKQTLRDDALFMTPPYILDRSRWPASQPLLVLFETPGCADCDQFHDQVLADPAIREMLSGFDVVRLDADDSSTPVLAPDGKRTTPAAWFESNEMSRLPALMFFDEQGRQVLTTDALVLKQRMENSLNFVLERAYEKGWTYQRFARSKGIERSLRRQQAP